MSEGHLLLLVQCHLLVVDHLNVTQDCMWVPSIDWQLVVRPTGLEHLRCCAISIGEWSRLTRKVVLIMMINDQKVHIRTYTSLSFNIEIILPYCLTVVEANNTGHRR